MGVKPKTAFGHGKIYVDYSRFWDYLMPVVQKCKESVDYEESKLYHEIEDALLSRIEIEETYQAVVEFIKIYNDER